MKIHALPRLGAATRVSLEREFPPQLETLLEKLENKAKFVSGRRNEGHVTFSVESLFDSAESIPSSRLKQARSKFRAFMKGLHQVCSGEDLDGATARNVYELLSHRISCNDIDDVSASKLLSDCIGCKCSRENVQKIVRLVRELYDDVRSIPSSSSASVGAQRRGITFPLNDEEFGSNLAWNIDEDDYLAFVSLLALIKPRVPPSSSTESKQPSHKVITTAKPPLPQPVVVQPQVSFEHQSADLTIIVDICKQLPLVSNNFTSSSQSVAILDMLIDSFEPDVDSEILSTKLQSMLFDFFGEGEIEAISSFMQQASLFFSIMQAYVNEFDTDADIQFDYNEHFREHFHSILSSNDSTANDGAISTSLQPKAVPRVKKLSVPTGRGVMAPSVNVVVAGERESDRMIRKEFRKKKKIADKQKSSVNASLPLKSSGGIILLGDQRKSRDALGAVGFSNEYLIEERSLGLQGGKARNMNSDNDNPIDNATGVLGLIRSREYHEQRSGLPLNAERKVTEFWEEIHIPAPSRPPPADKADLICIESSLESWAQLAFAGTKYLNRMQTITFDAAYNSSENMLICAPTGAGKTNVAMLAILQTVKQFYDLDSLSGRRGHEKRRPVIEGSQNSKIIYIAPMKALAQEVVAKFSERLAPLSLVVKEFTGDSQLSRQEIDESHVIVCTPEKWDVVTRKGGDGALSTMIKLLIIDEIHLLADERGAVIESVVVRLQRYVESSQSFVRIVGLSATLPNYKDVATFLKVNFDRGLFFFGPEFRPVPLEMSFIGVKAPNMHKKLDVMLECTLDNTLNAFHIGKQVMIFVQSRRDTVKTADALLALVNKKGSSDSSLLCPDRQNPCFKFMFNEASRSKNRDVTRLINYGIGIHHAGMLRGDRSLTERLFERSVIKLLICTSTLSWGVNLPAHTVIIKGTDFYAPDRGGWTDLSLLDVMQIFGRAGRPQYDVQGKAVLITQHTSLSKYSGMLGNKTPIESSFIKALADHMNAEIVNGTITNIREGVNWLSYTYLYVRMQKNPTAYGIDLNSVYQNDDGQLFGKREELVVKAAIELDRCMMARYDARSGNIAVTELGRIASHYYIQHDTIDVFNQMLLPGCNDVDALHVLCSSDEFRSLRPRPEELAEVDELKQNHAIVDIKCPVEETAGKVNVLLQTFMDRQSASEVKSFTLISDLNYISQNGGRISRALFEICLRKGWSKLCLFYLNLSKSIDKRVWWFDSPLRQFENALDPRNGGLPASVVKGIEGYCSRGRDGQSSVVHLRQLLESMDNREIASVVHSPVYAVQVRQYANMLPLLDVEAVVQPITRGIIRMTLKVYPDFTWKDRWHGKSETFWIWVEDSNTEYVYHHELLILTKKRYLENSSVTLVFNIPASDPLPAQYYVRCVSDRWVGCESLFPISFQHLIMPGRYPPNTNLMDLHPLPVSAIGNAEFQSLYRFTHFNPIQTQLFHVLYHTDNNILLGAPTGSGKTIVAELAILRLLDLNRLSRAGSKSWSGGGKIVYIAPLKALARERVKDWGEKFGKRLGLVVVELTGDVSPDIQLVKTSDIIITTPEKWDAVTRGWQKRKFVQSVRLVIIDEIHLLGEDRGPVLEAIVSRMRIIADYLATKDNVAGTSQKCRLIGLSTALANSRDLADWMGIGEVGMYNFKPSVRPIPMTVHIQGFPGKHYCPRMATMNKPTYAAILEYSPSKPVLVFVSSRRQTRLTALDLISFCASDDNSKRFLRMPHEQIADIVKTIKDSALQSTLSFGIGIHHAGLSEHDRNVVEDLFVTSKIQVLVCTSTLAWGVNFPAHLVVVKGTEYFDAKTSQYVDFPITDILQMMGRAGRPQFDTTGVSCILVHEPKKAFYKKLLFEPFPVESSFVESINNHMNAEIASSTMLLSSDLDSTLSRTGIIQSKYDAVEYLTCTYFYRRLIMNPSYYHLTDEMGVVPEVNDYTQRRPEMPNPKLEVVMRSVKETIRLSLIRSSISSVISPEIVERFLLGIIEKCFGDLELAGCIMTNPDRTVESTSIGKIAAQYYIDYRTADMFLKASKSFQSLSIQNLFRILCKATEYDQLPVRHNEDLMNAELAVGLPWPVEELKDASKSSRASSDVSCKPLPKKHDDSKCEEDDDNECDVATVHVASSVGDLFDDPHVKAFLLLQAHLTHCALPIADYINDTKSVLDQILRVLNAMIDIFACSGLFEPVLAGILSSQLIVQAKLPPIVSSHTKLTKSLFMGMMGVDGDDDDGQDSWENDEFLLALHESSLLELTQLPGIASNQQAEIFESVFRQMLGIDSQMPVRLLQRLASMKESQLLTLVRHCEPRGLFGGNASIDFMRVVSELPVIDVLRIHKIVCVTNRQDVDLLPNINLNFDMEYEVDIEVNINHLTSKARVHCPQFHKPKNFGWWLVLAVTQDAANESVISKVLLSHKLGDLKNISLLGVRRVSKSAEGGSLEKFVFKIPARISGSGSLVVYCVSDCIIGLDEEFVSTFTLGGAV